MGQGTHQIEASYQIVTPMFLGDGDAKRVADAIRPPSVKGALRFWWRAMAWSRLYDGNEASTLKKVHREEAALFGAAADEKSGGQGKFLLQVESDVKTTGRPNNIDSGQAYLLGQGLHHFRNGPTRDALISGSFPLRLRLRPRVSDEQRRQLADTLLLFGLLGGLGSRSRRGGGSVSITDLQGDHEGRQTPADRNTYFDTLRSLLNGSQAYPGIPPYSAFSTQTRIDVSDTDSSATALLSRAGEEMQLFRSFGRKNKVNGKKAEQNFRDDHDLIFRAINREEKSNQLPRRTVFGLPHNYFFSSIKKKMDIAPSDAGRTRRASPLLVHIQALPNGQCLLVQTMMIARFLPKGSKINRGKFPVPAPDPDWQVLHAYMDRFSMSEPLFP